MKTDIGTFSENLMEKLQADNLVEDSTDFNTTGKTLSAIRQALGELRKYVLTYHFDSEEEEVRFFKELKPVFLCQYYYYHKKFSILLFDSFGDSQSSKNNCERILAEMQRYAFRHRHFYQYCVSAQHGRDNSYFTRNKYISQDIEFDEAFSTGYDVILSRLLAH